MNKTRILTLLLAALMTASTLVMASCGGDTSADAETTAQNGGDADTTAAETTTAEKSAYDYLEKTDYDGYKFRILAASSSTKYYPDTLVPEAMTGEIIYDAAFERNQAVEDYYNIKMSYIDGTQDQVSNAILAGEDLCDLTVVTINKAGSMAAQGMFVDVNTIDAINTEMPWYSQKVMDMITVNGKTPMIASDFNCQYLCCTYGLFFNQSMAYEEFNLPDIYETTLNGDWTFDKLQKYSKSVAADVDGNGTMDLNDRYGYGYSAIYNENLETPIIHQYGMGQFTTTMDADGMPKLALNTERMAKIVEYVNELYHADDTLSSHTAWNDAIKIFAASRMLFLNCIIMHAPNYMRYMEDTYGILPMPKFDEEQEEYYTTVSPGSAMFEVIPVTVSDAQRTGSIFEALAYEGSKRVIPAFFETSMKVKYSHDETTSLVFDMLRDSRVVDFGMIYDGGVKMSYLISKVITSDAGGFASQYAALEDRAIAQYNSVIEAFSK